MKGKVICYSYRNKYRKRLARDKVTEKCGKILDKRYCSFFKLFSDFIFLSKKLGKKVTHPSTIFSSLDIHPEIFNPFIPHVYTKRVVLSYLFFPANITSC